MASAASPPQAVTPNLPPRLLELYRALDGQGDVDIIKIYEIVVGPPPRPLRETQQYLGPYITKLNRRLREHGLKVKPGRIKGTYCLTTL